MLSILSLNLRFGLADDGPNNWGHRQKIFPSFLEKHRADFMGFQESNDFQTDFLEDILREYRMIGKRSPAPRFWQNNIIFYKKEWECVHYEHLFLSPTPTIPSRFPKSKWPRQCTIGMFERDGTRVICVNSHFDFDAEVQTDSAVFIMERLSRLPSDLPALVMGDFNATPSRPCYQVFTGQHPAPDAKGPYFRSVFSEPFPATFHGFTGNTDGKHIDWILWRGGLALEKSEVIHDAIDGMYPSDHFPVFATFRIL